MTRVLLLGDATSVHVRRWVEGLSDAGIDVVQADIAAGSLPRAIRFAAAVPRIRSVIRRLRPDIVHAHFASSYGVLAALTCGARPLVVSVWGSDVLQSAAASNRRRLVRRALRRASLVTFDSDDAGDAVAELAPSAHRTKLVFGPARAWCAALRQDEPVILSPRGLQDIYRPEVVLGAFERFRRQWPDWTLEVMTGGLAAPRDAPPGVRFVPRIPHEEMLEFFLRASAFCSVPRSDATAASLLEGMAAGSLPIVSDLPANRSWVTGGVNGLVVPVDDVVALAEAMSRAAADQELRLAAAAVNRERIAAEATWEGAVEALVREYKAVLTDHPGRRP